jgi:hypothetical protein
MPSYVPTPAGEVETGDKVRPLRAVGPSVPKPEHDAYPWTVASVQKVRNGRVRIWAHPHGARVSIESPSNYGNFDAADTVEVWQ